MLAIGAALQPAQHGDVAGRCDHHADALPDRGQAGKIADIFKVAFKAVEDDGIDAAIRYGLRDFRNAFFVLIIGDFYEAHRNTSSLALVLLCSKREFFSKVV